MKAYHDDFDQITVILPHDERQEKAANFKAYGHEEVIDLTIESVKSLPGEHKYILAYDTFIFLNKSYTIKDDVGNETDLYSGKIVRTEHFDELYYYEENDLGHTYDKAHTTFKLWSPVAKSAEVILTHQGKTSHHTMTYTNQGVYAVTVKGNLEGARYRYKVHVNGKDRTITDLYGVASTANGKANYVVNPKNFTKMKHDRPAFSGVPNDAIIYEISIRDLTSSVKINSPMTFKAAAKENLKTPENNPVAFDYIKDLGVTHVQLMPIYDFEGVDEKNARKRYNWGYNPSQYFVPEGSYATDPNDPYARINELRAFVDHYHKHGIRLTMDVVYNHVYNSETFPYEHLVPGYGYRYDNQGMMTNASGCGNDLATERKMVRKLIVDNVMYWTKTFNLDGFRFDLMGLIDLKTMHTIRQKLETHDKTILVYGEGWQMQTVLPKHQLTHMNNKRVLYNIGFFNDHFRDDVKGSTFNLKHAGFALGNNDCHVALKSALFGSLHRFSTATQSLNYVECHDNHTLYDKIQKAMPDDDDALKRKRQDLATAITLLAQGVPFIHLGQEFYRSKNGNGNSYKSPDAINTIHWEDTDTHQESIHRVKQLIALRKNHSVFRYHSKQAIREHIKVAFTDHGSCLYTITSKEETVCVIFKPNPEKETLKLDGEYDTLYQSAPIEQSSNTITLTTVCVVVLKHQ